jgi:hypothetical protein
VLFESHPVEPPFARQMSSRYSSADVAPWPVGAPHCSQ